MSRQLQTLVSPVKTETLMVIENQSPESEIVEIGIDDIFDSSETEEEIIADVKDADIVSHPVFKQSIKSEILESKHCESVETQVLVKAENSPFINTENITQRNKTEDTSDKNVTKGTGQAVVEVQGSNELSTLETDAQLVLNFSKYLNNSTRIRKAKQPEKTSRKKDKEKIKVTKKPVIPVEAYEYISLAEDKYVCNHCQRVYNRSCNLRKHIRTNHRSQDHKNNVNNETIKKPLSAFMLYIKEMRPKLAAECSIQESTALNQILGRRWRSLSREEQAKYIEKARLGRQLHMQLYPGWRQRYTCSYGTKKKKRKYERKYERAPTESGGNSSGGAKVPPCKSQYGLPFRKILPAPSEARPPSTATFCCTVVPPLSMEKYRAQCGLDQQSQVCSSQDHKNNVDGKNNQDNEKKKPHIEKPPQDIIHIKKPPNAFMLYMKEKRAKVVAECKLKESAAINQILGRMWHSLSREEQAKYYEEARLERQLHKQLYPGWSARDNYTKTKKRKKERARIETLGNSMKKCRARYGLHQESQWCVPCRRKKKCIRYMESGESNDGNQSDDNLASCGSMGDANTPPDDDNESLNQSMSSSGGFSTLSSPTSPGGMVLPSPSTSVASPSVSVASPYILQSPLMLHDSFDVKLSPPQFVREFTKMFPP